MALFENYCYYSTGDLYINKTLANKDQRIENILYTVLPLLVNKVDTSSLLSENLPDIVVKLLHIFYLGVDVSPLEEVQRENAHVKPVRGNSYAPFSQAEVLLFYAPTLFHCGFVLYITYFIEKRLQTLQR